MQNARRKTECKWIAEKIYNQYKYIELTAHENSTDFTEIVFELSEILCESYMPNSRRIDATE